MFSAMTANAFDQIKTVEDLIVIHDTAMAEKDAGTRQRMKLYSVSSCVTRLYAIYERFIETIISDFLDSVPELLPYDSLPEELKKDYRIGISHILSRVDSDRYKHLTHENVIRWYHEALTNTEKYQFVTEALTRHDQNLRLNTVESILSRVQLKDLQPWLANSIEIKSLYPDQASVYEQVDAELRNFIQLRNDAAHGMLEDLEGKDNLTRFCQVIKALIISIASYLHKSLLTLRASSGKIRKIGKVTEVFGRSGAFIAQLEDTAEVSEGMKIHLVGAHYCYSQNILSLKINEEFVAHAISDHNGFEVGVKCQISPKKKAEIFIDA